MSSHLTSAGAAFLTLNAARTATERAAFKTAEFGEQLDRVAKAEALGQIDARLWARAAAHVVELNARIAMASARAARAGTRVALPEPLDLGGCDMRRASEWCVRAAEHLKAAQIALHQKLGRREPPGGLAPDSSAALARYEEMMRERYRGETDGPIVTRLDADMWVALRSLDPDAYEAEHARVLAVIAQVARLVTYPPETSPLVVRMRATIDEVNEAVAGRRLAAKWLYALESTSQIDTVAKLRRVLSGDAALHGALRREAPQAIGWRLSG